MTEHEPRQPLSDSRREMLEEAVAGYETALAADDTAVRYLLDRGIDETVARTSRLGVVADPAPGHESRRGRLAIPYLHHTGYPLTIRFRCLENHSCREVGCPKYLPIDGDPVRMFSTGSLMQAQDTLHVTEGELDALVLNKVGLPAVGVPGANNWASHFRVLLLGFSRVWVWGDGDTAGAEFVNKVCASLRQAKGVRVPRGADVTDLYLQGGEAALFELIDQKGR